MDSRNIGTDNPIVPDFPIVVDVLVAGSSCLLPVFAWFDFRGVFELLFGNVVTETGVSSLQRGKFTKIRPSGETVTPVS